MGTQAAQQQQARTDQSQQEGEVDLQEALALAADMNGDVGDEEDEEDEEDDEDQ